MSRLRKNKLIKPVFQLRMAGVFCMAAMAGILGQFILLNSVLSQMGRKNPVYAELLREQWPSMLLTTLWISIGLILPFTIGVGILASFRIAGPLYRFEQYMRQVARGQDPGVCKIRDGDMLQTTCNVVNELCEPIRERNAQALAEKTDDEAKDLPDVDQVASLTEQREQQEQPAAQGQSAS